LVKNVVIDVKSVVIDAMVIGVLLVKGIFASGDPLRSSCKVLRWIGLGKIIPTL